MSLSDFYFKKLGKMLNDPYYEIAERYVPKLLDADFIQEKKWTEHTLGVICSCSCYVVTTKGEKAYGEWQPGS